MVCYYTCLPFQHVLARKLIEDCVVSICNDKLTLTSSLSCCCCRHKCRKLLQLSELSNVAKKICNSIFKGIQCYNKVWDGLEQPAWVALLLLFCGPWVLVVTPTTITTHLLIQEVRSIMDNCEVKNFKRQAYRHTNFDWSDLSMT